MKTIVCVDKEWGIGKNNDLLFHLKGDMQYFKSKTTDKVVVMGKNTLISFPGSKPLKNRVNIVLVDDDSLNGVEGITLVRSIPEMLQAAARYNTDDVFVVGGASVYRQMLPYCDQALITKVDTIGGAQVFFPNLDLLDEWYLDSCGDQQTEGDLTYSFCTYKRR